MPERHASSEAALSPCGAVNNAELSARAQTGPRVRVLLPLPLPAVLDYRVPDGEPLPEPGAFVRVPLSGRTLVGVVWDGEAAEFASERLRTVAESYRCARWNRRCGGSSSGLPPTRWRPRERCCAWR